MAVAPVTPVLLVLVDTKRPALTGATWLMIGPLKSRYDWI